MGCIRPQNAVTARTRIRSGRAPRPETEPGDAALELLPTLRDGDRFSATTVLALLGTPLPGLLDRVVHVTAGRGLERPRRFGVWGHDEDGQALAWWGGAPISTPERAFIESARTLSTDDLVVAGDWLTHDPRFAENGRPFTTVTQILAATAPGMRHVRRIREAISLIRPSIGSSASTTAISIARA